MAPRLPMLAAEALVLLAFTGGPTQAAPGPPPSAGHALVYHDSLGAVLLLNAGLGGHDTPPADTRTIIWRWTGSAWTVLDSLGPPARNLGGVAYDSRRSARRFSSEARPRRIPFQWTPGPGTEPRGDAWPRRDPPGGSTTR